MKFFQKLAFLLVFIPTFSFAGDIPPEILENIRKGVITIDSRISVSAYQDKGNFKGTGFIADKKEGLVVTNAHVISPASIGIYYVNFFNGKQSEAKLLYYDSWQDFAILKIDPSEFPKESQNIPFSKELPKRGQDVFIVGNNEAQGFSFHSGYLSNLYDINGNMPQRTYIVNLNVTGGSSGSPLVNLKGEALGINYGGSKTFGMSLKGEYITYALDYVKKNQIPVRKHMGAMLDIYSLDKAVNHRHFPKDKMEKYIKDNPDYRNKVITVNHVLSNSGAASKLLPGDIIWEVNKKMIGPDLFMLDDAMNKSITGYINLTIYRDGKEMNMDVPLYNIMDYQVSKLIDFAGAIIFKADDFSAAKTGVALGDIGFVHVQKGSGMSKIPTFVRYADKITYRLKIEKLNKHKVTDLDSVLAILPKIVKEQFITIDFKNYQPYFEAFDQTFQSGHHQMSSDITLDALDVKPRVMEFEFDKGQWKVEEIR